MKYTKCPVCGSYIKPNKKVCPICKTRFSKAQLFFMIWFKRVVWTVICAVIIYNIGIIIYENRYIRQYVNNVPSSGEIVDQLEERYNNLNFIQKFFVRGKDIESIRKKQAAASKVFEVVDEDRTIYFETKAIKGKYTGTISSNLPNGKGTFSYKVDEWLKCVYTGSFVSGQMTGEGMKEFSNGYKHVGTFLNGQLNGYATVYNEKGNVIKQGDFINDKLNGEGSSFDNNKGLIYSGRFSEDIPEKEEYISACTPLDYNYLKANYSSYINKNIKIHGRIVSATQYDSYTDYVVAPNNSATERIHVFNFNKTNISRSSYMYIYGCCMNNNSTYTQNDIQNEEGIGILAFYFSAVEY